MEKQLQSCFDGIPRKEDENVIGAIVPFGGTLLSGSVAASVYAKLPRADTFVILVPHDCEYDSISLTATTKNTWVTPLGEIEIDEAFVDALPRQLFQVEGEIAYTRYGYADSIDLQLFFLQFLFDNKFRFVPIALGLNDERTTKEIGEALADTIAKFNKKVVLIAAWIFQHYQLWRIAEEKDKHVIRAIESLDIAKFYKSVYERNVRTGGIVSVAALMHAIRILGAKEGKLIKYAMTGDYSTGVTYLGIIISKRNDLSKIDGELQTQDSKHLEGNKAILRQRFFHGVERK